MQVSGHGVMLNPGTLIEVVIKGIHRSDCKKLSVKRVLWTDAAGDYVWYADSCWYVRPNGKGGYVSTGHRQPREMWNN